MSWLVAKYLITAGIIVGVSEVAKRHDRLGALLVALPTVTVLAMIWLYLEGQPHEKIATHARYTFWYVLPTLPMFLVFPLLIDRLGFWLALSASSVVAIICFFSLALVLKIFGVNLLS
jgi:hypothetical protein